MKKRTKIIIGIVAAVLVLAIALGWLFLNLMFGQTRKTTSDIAYYQALSGETEGANTLPFLGEQYNISCAYDLPWLSELEPYEDYRFNYTARWFYIFEAHSYVLIVRYDTDTYAQQKEKLEADHTWLTAYLPGESSDNEHNPVFEMDGFHFRAVEEKPHHYPKYMLYVGTSDETREVAYIYFHDGDLDYLSPTVADFLREETGWDKVVR